VGKIPQAYFSKLLDAVTSKDMLLDSHFKNETYFSLTPYSKSRNGHVRERLKNFIP
jgi:hypothetical protein